MYLVINRIYGDGRDAETRIIEHDGRHTGYSQHTEYDEYVDEFESLKEAEEFAEDQLVEV